MKAAGGPRGGSPEVERGVVGIASRPELGEGRRGNRIWDKVRLPPLGCARTVPVSFREGGLFALHCSGFLAMTSQSNRASSRFFALRTQQGLRAGTGRCAFRDCGVASGGTAYRMCPCHPCLSVPCLSVSFRVLPCYLEGLPGYQVVGRL